MSIIRVITGIYLFIHGFCHLVGFFVPWKIISMEEQPYLTTLFNNTVDVGAVGIRIMGIIWLITGLLFIACSVSLFIRSSWWYNIILYLTIFSILLCISGLPGAKIGIPANIVILIFLFINKKMELFSTL